MRHSHYTRHNTNKHWRKMEPCMQPLHKCFLFRPFGKPTKPTKPKGGGRGITPHREVWMCCSGRARQHTNVPEPKGSATTAPRLSGAPLEQAQIRRGACREWETGLMPGGDGVALLNCTVGEIRGHARRKKRELNHHRGSHTPRHIIGRAE